MEEKFRVELLTMLDKRMSKEQISAVDMALTALFRKYDVSESCTELAVCDDSNERIINTYIASMRLEGRSEKTLKQYYDALTKLLDEIPKNIKDIKTNDIRYHLAHYQSTHKVSNATVNNKRKFLSAFFVWATKEEIIDRNPMLKINSIKEKYVTKKPFSDIELAKIRDVLKNDREKALVEFLLSTGCRVSEVAGLKVEDVNFRDGECVVCGKGNKERTVYINNKAMNNYRILVVDDEEDLCEILKFNLENEGYEVDTANSAEEALRMDIGSYNLLLLDVMMGEISGFKMASMLKKDKKTAQIPIIFITAKDTENDTVTGFNLGADDYISKPFSLREVAARVKAVLRRTQQGETEHAPEQIVYKTLVLNVIKKKVCIDGEEAPLTKKEFEILLLLLQNKGRVFSREDILNRIWSDEVYVLDRTIDVNITRLRKKIGVYGKCIVTRLGYGYCFEAE